MKMSNTHYLALLEALRPIVPHLKAHRDTLKNDPKVKSVDTRLTWDAYWATKISSKYSYQEWDYKDTHIENAVKKALKELGYKGE